MARLTEKDWKRLRSTTPYKGSFTRPIPRWTTSRKGRADSTAWTRKIAGKIVGEPQKELPE